MEYQFEKNRIYALDANRRLLAEVTFPSLDANRVEIDHVYVTNSLRGQGIAARLMELAYAQLKQNNTLIIATCPYAVAWFIKHPEYQDIVLNLSR